MDRASILSGTAFRTAVYAVIAVLAVLIVTGAGAFVFVQQTLEREIEQQILDEQVMLREIYEKGGETALIRTIAEINNPVVPSLHAIGVFGPDGLKLAGNISDLPSRGSFHRTTLTLDGTGDVPLPFYVHSILFDRIVLVIGHDLSLIAATERRLLAALLCSGLLAGGVILLIGYAASRKSLHKLNDLETTLDHVSQGNSEIRVPVTGENDQIDRISHRVNTHLDRLSSLMVTTRSTAIAIAHDLKTPLSRAHLSLQTAFSRIDDGQDPRDALEKTEAELERLNRIFDTILRISRIETAPQDAEFRSFALPPLLIDLAETFAPMAEEDGQSLKLSLPGTPVSAVFGDERMVRQMIVNLIQNAMRHGTAGNLITIELQQADGRCIVDIADHGPGIPQDERARVFEAFYRLDSSRSGGGGGLGLALVKAIAQRHDIAIDLADNAPGLRVRLTFPPARPVSPASELVG